MVRPPRLVFLARILASRQCERASDGEEREGARIHILTYTGAVDSLSVFGDFSIRPKRVRLAVVHVPCEFVVEFVGWIDVPSFFMAIPHGEIVHAFDSAPLLLKNNLLARSAFGGRRWRNRRMAHRAARRPRCGISKDVS